MMIGWIGLKRGANSLIRMHYSWPEVDDRAINPTTYYTIRVVTHSCETQRPRRWLRTSRLLTAISSLAACDSMRSQRSSSSSAPALATAHCRRRRTARCSARWCRRLTKKPAKEREGGGRAKWICTRRSTHTYCLLPRERQVFDAGLVYFGIYTYRTVEIRFRSRRKRCKFYFVCLK